MGRVVKVEMAFGNNVRNGSRSKIIRPELFGYHVDVWKANYHRHFNHEWMRYASYWLQYYWAQKHGVDVVGNVWTQSRYPEDPLMTYQRLYCNNDLQTLYTELYGYATRMVTYDMDVVRNYVTETACNYINENV